MKISELVAFRNHLASMSATSIQYDADTELSKISHLIKNQNQFDPGHNVEKQHNAIQQAFRDFETYLTDLKQQVDQQIRIDEQALLQSSTNWFKEQTALYNELSTVDEYHYDQYGVKVLGPDKNKQQRKIEFDNQILSRRGIPSQETFNFYKSRVLGYPDWQYPGMIIHPGHETFIKDMVPNDPLYLLDVSRDLLQPAMDPFPALYQRRLRTYVINELSGSLLGTLPDNQFGLCLVYQYLNFRPLEIVKQYISEVYQKLRPGGTLIMTFNDCDRVPGVRLAEQGYSCYTPGRFVIQHAESLGFIVNLVWHDDGPSTWLEIRKPGALTSLRGGQTMAKIIAKPEAAELHVLRSLANEFRMDDPVRINTYTSDELRKLIIMNGKENILKDLAKSK